ncbi:hypothetical protein [Planococcus sp. SSTMD024]|uniref:hypothetical protein n=1 Tax=Planococcus sp. SSTMD024 TaxID=3242163 RepID=UPI00351DEA83
MIQQEPLEKKEFPSVQNSTEPVEPKLFDHSMHHPDGLVEPIIKEYIPLQIGMVIFSIAILVVVFIGSTAHMWGLIE